MPKDKQDNSAPGALDPKTLLVISVLIVLTVALAWFFRVSFSGE